MFERFTEQARRSLFFARYEASQLGSLSIESPHLLLGIMRELTGPMLAGLPADLRLVLESKAKSANQVPLTQEIPFSEETKQALQSAAEEADRLQHSYIGPEHLILGLLNYPRSEAAKALLSHGLSLELAREQAKVTPAPPSIPDARAALPHLDRLLELVRQLAETTRGNPDATVKVATLAAEIERLRRLLAAP